MTYARISLKKTNYKKIDNYKFISNKDIDVRYLNDLYTQYCQYKKFKSVMPIFESEYTDVKNDVIGYYDPEDYRLIAFSLIRKYDNTNVEAIQFAWDYKKPELKLGIESLRNECAIYKELGFEYFYLGGADEYKSKFDGFEILGPL